MAYETLLAEYEARRAKALAGGGAEKYQKRTAAGVWNARERIAYLVDKGSFLETGLFGASGVYPEQADETQTDGKLAGYGRINGRDVAIVVNDFTVKGASTSATNSKKIAHMKRVSTERGVPLVVIGESMRWARAGWGSSWATTSRSSGACARRRCAPRRSGLRSARPPG
jgi:methylmalonyl-CoA decarboxylase subunit alpha